MTGYKIIDLTNFDFKTNALSYTKEGVYKSLEETRKPILVTNLVIEGLEIGSFYTFKELKDSNFILKVGDLGTLTITDKDVITYAKLSTAKAGAK